MRLSATSLTVSSASLRSRSRWPESPKLLLLDEPTAGLSPAESHMMTALLKKLDSAMTLLVIEHDMDVAFELTDRITVLHYGKVVADGFSHEVKSNPLVQEIYLGAGLEDA